MSKIYIVAQKTVFLMLAILGGALIATTSDEFTFTSIFVLFLLVSNSIAFNCIAIIGGKE